MAQIELWPHDKVIVTERQGKKDFRKEGTICAVHNQFITVDYGSYKHTIDRMDVKRGLVKIEKVGGEEMSKSVLDINVLLKECRKYGTNTDASKIIAKKHNLTEKQVRNAIYHNNVKLRLEQEQIKPASSEDVVEKLMEIAEKTKPEPEPEPEPMPCQEHGPDCIVTQHKWGQEHSLGLPMPEKNIAVTKDPENKELFYFSEKLAQSAAPKERPRLKPKTLTSTSLDTANGHEIEYMMLKTMLVVNLMSKQEPGLHLSTAIEIKWEDLKDFIEDLKELARMAEVIG